MLKPSLQLGAVLLEASHGRTAWETEERFDLGRGQDASGLPHICRMMSQYASEQASADLEETPTPTAQPSSPAQPPPDQEPSTALPIGWLPGGQLFTPLLADPRWPHFSASYLYYFDDEELDHVGTISLGEVIPLYRVRGPLGGQSEVGLQGSVFATFDLAADSHDLINADYWAALHGAYRKGGVSAMGRVYHRSSHLGDEYLLRGDVERLELSLEGVDLRLSYDLPHGFRVYGGAGFLINQKSTDLDPWATQIGLEFRSPWSAWGGHLRPVAAADMKNTEENDWSADLSLRAGIQFDSIAILGRSMQLLVQYYNGYSPDGQFYKERIQYLGVGIHFYF